MDQQVSMLAVELRNQRNALVQMERHLNEAILAVRTDLKTDVSAVRHDVKWLLRGVWGLAGPLFIGLLLYVLTNGGHP